MCECCGGDCKLCQGASSDSLEPYIYVSFQMPYGGVLSIKSSKPNEDIDIDEEVDDLKYRIYWDKVLLPWFATTKKDAMGIAMGCQWGAYEMIKRMNG